MKKIALIGDSIRFGYQPYVMKALAGTAAVWAPEINGGDSRNVINHLTTWMDAAKPNIVHINCGLHDLKKAFDTGLLAVPIAEYSQNIKFILNLLSQIVPHVIWATTTPVNTVWHHAVKLFDRFEEDVLAYNAVAIAVAGTLDVEVNDLYTKVMAAGRDKLLLSDGVHFNEYGYSLLGERVSATLTPFL